MGEVLTWGPPNNKPFETRELSCKLPKQKAIISPKNISISLLTVLLFFSCIAERARDMVTRKPNVANRCVHFVVPDVRKVRLAEAAGAEVFVQQRHEKWQFSSQNVQNISARTNFGCYDLEKGTSLKRKAHSKWTKNLSARKMARRCGAKHIFKSNVQNTSVPDQVWMLRSRKKCTPRGAKQIFKSMHKTHQCGANFGCSDGKKWHAAVARSTFLSQMHRTTYSDHCLKAQKLQNVKSVSQSIRKFVKWSVVN